MVLQTKSLPERVGCRRQQVEGPGLFAGDGIGCCGVVGGRQIDRNGLYERIDARRGSRNGDIREDDLAGKRVAQRNFGDGAGQTYRHTGVGGTGDEGRAGHDEGGCRGFGAGRGHGDAVAEIVERRGRGALGRFVERDERRKRDAAACVAQHEDVLLSRGRKHDLLAADAVVVRSGDLLRFRGGDSLLVVLQGIGRDVENIDVVTRDGPFFGRSGRAGRDHRTADLHLDAHLGLLPVVLQYAVLVVQVG